MSELALKRIAKNKKTKARSLDLSDCGLTTLPSELGDCIWLEELILGNELPVLKTLRYVSALLKDGDKANNVIAKRKNNKIVNLDEVLPKLENLKKLIFWDQPISDLSPLSGLTNLEQIYCLSTQISDLSPLSGLINLKQLNCSSTQVSDLSPLSELTNLEKLDCAGTKVSDLTPISGLKKLVRLDCSNSLVNNLFPILSLISDNKVEVTMSWLGWVDSNRFIFEDCPLTNPPVEVVEQGSETILRYFDEREKAGSDQIYEAKLLLIGEGGAGKTSLCRKLFDPKADLLKEQDTTRGVDIQSLYFDLPNGKEFRLNVWDFAGQGKYQSAHSFFYTHRSLYVLVDDTRTLDENEAYRTFYNYWLQTAELFGGNSPLLIYLTPLGFVHEKIVEN